MTSSGWSPSWPSATSTRPQSVRALPVSMRKSFTLPIPRVVLELEGRTYKFVRECSHVIRSTCNYDINNYVFVTKRRGRAASYASYDQWLHDDQCYHVTNSSHVIGLPIITPHNTTPSDWCWLTALISTGPRSFTTLIYVFMLASGTLF